MAMASTTSAAVSMLLSGSMSSPEGLMNPSFLARTVLPFSSSMATISASAPFPTVMLDLTHRQDATQLRRPSPSPAQFQFPFAAAAAAAGYFAVPNASGQTHINQSRFSGLQLSEAMEASEFPHPKEHTALPSSLADTVTAATAAITADPNFTAALAAAISSIINGNRPATASDNHDNRSSASRTINEDDNNRRRLRLGRRPQEDSRRWESTRSKWFLEVRTKTMGIDDDDDDDFVVHAYYLLCLCLRRSSHLSDLGGVSSWNRRCSHLRLTRRRNNLRRTRRSCRSRLDDFRLNMDEPYDYSYNLCRQKGRHFFPSPTTTLHLALPVRGCNARRLGWFLPLRTRRRGSTCKRILTRVGMVRSTTSCGFLLRVAEEEMGTPPPHPVVARPAGEGWGVHDDKIRVAS
ncbi:hypothetical protein GW17_00047751 [Ensete ventricosum]|nr:hypothetical protein GW17_00047751 [Ensete ventricosum]